MSSIRVRSFTPEGTSAFANLILAKPHNIVSEVRKLIQVSSLTQETGADIEIRDPKNRLGMAKILWEVFGEQGLLYSRRRDRDLWNWVAAAYFETLLNSDIRINVNRKIGGVDRWIMSGSVLYAHRHLVSGPFFAYEANISDPKRAMCQLSTPVTEPGELVERISGKRELSSGSPCHLATLMYYDSEKGVLRPGLTTPPGNPKKFGTYFKQIERTLDFESMDASALLEVLPSNFDKWKKHAKRELDKQNGKNQ